MSRVSNPRASVVRPLTARQVEVLEAVHYGEVIWTEYRKHYKDGLASWEKPVLLGVDVSSVTRKLKDRKLLRVRSDRECTIRRTNYGSMHYRYYALTPAGLAELDKHPAPWKD